ncbi:MAG: type IX secretion system sortase PorU [Melioribacteraceae bacterium]|nr:type IX secretion system sortase PorU [Melioribacteraceae bacterium]
MKLKFSLIFLLFILNLIYAQDLKVLTSNQNYLILEYRPVIKDTITSTISGRTFTKLEIDGTFVENYKDFGMPQLQVKLFNVGVPSEFGNTIEILDSKSKTYISDYLPNPKVVKDSSITKQVEFVSENYNLFNHNELIQFGDYGLVRNLPVQTLKIYPVIFEPNSKIIKVYDYIKIKINFGNSSTKKIKINEDYLSSLIVNWDVAQFWGEEIKSLNKISNSVLSVGPWFRIEVSEEGIYKIDRAFLQNLGVDVNTVDPRTIKIYNNGGLNLPENYNTYKNEGLIENSILFVGEADGKIDAADYILFYGRGTEVWNYNSNIKTIVRSKNPYAKKNYYWLTFGGNNGKRITEKPSLNIPNAFVQNSTFGFRSYDKDSVNIGKSGRQYFGDVIDATTKSRTFVSTLNGIVPNSRINYTVRTVNASSATIPIRIDESNTQVYSNSIYGISDYDYAIEDIAKFSFQGNLSDERSILKLSHLSVSISAKVYLDYFEIIYSRFLRAAGDNFILFGKDTTATIEYTVTNFSSSSIQVFDVTDFSNVKLITNAITSGGQIKFQTNETKNNPSKYLVVSSNGYKVPSGGIKIDNMNIRGNVSGSQMIVITHKDFKTQAERYVKYRSSESPNKLTTQVFYIDEIFNEFSCGMIDPMAIRDFLKYAYENWQTKPFYVLLFGDGTYDYLNTVKDNKNFIITYQTENSIDEISSYTSDDYFVRISGNDLKPDLAIGRLTIQTAKEADNAIDKIINYETVQGKGDWRNTITLVADDGPTSSRDDGSLHTSQSESLALKILPEFIYQKKIYLVAYPTVYVGLGRRKPDVNKAIIDAINEGTLLLNYIGHGSPELWAHENVFVKTTTIPQLKNSNYFFLTAATCDFGLYDDPAIQSSAETMMNLQNAGSILAYTSSRIVYSNYNAELNEILYNNLFNLKDNGLPARVGLSYYMTKQYMVDRENDEKFHLFGDPAIRMNMPVLPISIDSINGRATKDLTQISALSNVKIKGSVKTLDGKINPVNGEVVISVFDSERGIFYQEMDYTVKQQGGLIFKGRASVKNGLFETSFVVPKDISYENKNGKMIAYFFNNQIDGVGYSKNFTVGGTNPNAVNDNKGPEIEIFFDNENFANAYLVNSDFTLIAKLKDQTGLNTTGTGIGHKLEAILNDDITNSIDLSNNFVGDLNSGGKSGVVKYNFIGMKDGDYKIKIKAWDVFNNLSTQEANFTVVSNEKGIILKDVYNFPNPFSSFTTFTFQHNYSSSINCKIKIYTVAGRLIRTIEINDMINKFVKIDWDGRDDDGNQIANGTYFYKLIVESVDGSFKKSVIGKLAVIK